MSLNLKAGNNLTSGNYSVTIANVALSDYDGNVTNETGISVGVKVTNTFTLSITASGNGSVSYRGTTIRSKTSSFTVDEGTSATISFSPDNGCEIKTVKVNGSTVSVTNNQYTISSINRNTTVEVEFEAIASGIDITQYISATSVGGFVTQTNNLIQSGSKLNWKFSNNSTESVTLNSMQLIDGSTGSAGNLMTINEAVGANSSVSYTTSIGAAGIHTPVTCRFRYTYNGTEYSTDAVYSGTILTGYTLSIKASGNGQVSYKGNTIRNTTKSYSVDMMASATLTFTPDNGYQIKSVKVNNNDVTSRVSNNNYTINMITSNQSVEVEFEAIPATYTLSVKSIGNGYVTYNETTIRDKTRAFTVNEGSSATITFSPNKGHRIKSVIVNNIDVTANISFDSNTISYTISSINNDTSVEVEFELFPVITEIGELIKQMEEKCVTADKALAEFKIAVNNSTLDASDFLAKYQSYISNLDDIIVVIASLKVQYSAAYNMTYQDEKQINEVLATANKLNSQIDQLIASITKDYEQFISIQNNAKTLTIKAIGNGYAYCNRKDVRNNTITYTVKDGSSATIVFSPDNGYQIKHVLVNNVTVSLTNNQYIISSIKENTTIEVEFEVIPPSIYNMTYMVDGEVYKSYQIQEGASITPEPAPTKEGYTFSGWSDIPKTMPDKDVTITGTFTINKYKLIYKVDGEVYKTYEVEYGTNITPEAEPTKEGYTFSGWSGLPATMPAKDVTVTGRFTKQTFKLIYMVDGEVYKTENYTYGSTILPVAKPTKEGHTFSGWNDMPTTMPANDVTVTGTFTVNKYKLIYKVDGEVYKTYELEYGTSITPEAEPTKEGYTFSGWSGVPATMPAKDVTVTGRFTKQTFKLIYMVNGEGYKTESYSFGSTILPEPNITKEGYTFSGWSDIPQTMPANDVTVTSTLTINIYKLIYKVDDEVYKTYEVEYGTNITPEAEPTKEGYTFSGWSYIPSKMPAEDVVVVGFFTQVAVVIDHVKYEIDGNNVSVTPDDDATGEIKIEESVVINGQTYNVTAIAKGAFQGCVNLTSVEIPSSITTIGENAFEGCSGLTIIKIGKGIKEIGSKAFANIAKNVASTRGDDDGLKLYCEAEVIPSTAADAFENTPIDKGTLIVADELVNVYKLVMPWNGFGTIVGLTTDIRSIAIESENAFIFDMQGNRLDNVRKGVNIIRTKDGKTKKIVVK